VNVVKALTDAEASVERSFARSLALSERLHAVIPGGAHTYAKGDDQYPADALPVLVRGEGCRVWDVDGNEFFEYGMGLRAVTLGHAFEPVLGPVRRQLEMGSNFLRPTVLELECAEEFCALIGGDMVKFAKNGSDVTTAAVKLARAYTGRNRIAICGDQPFFSIDDWFIGATPVNAGIPSAISDLTLKFKYNDLDSAAALFAAYPGEIAALILEAETAIAPAPGFLEQLKALCHQHGALLILDEMITGFRWHNGGASAYYGFRADLACYGKALGNGFAISALTGRREIMDLGGIRHSEPRVFLLSTTHGAESSGLAAARAVMRAYQDLPVVDTMWRQGERLASGVRRVVTELGIGDYFQVMGQPCNLVFATRDQNKQPSQPFRTLFLRETLRRGLIMPSMVVSFSHSDAVIDATIERVGEALRVYKRALEDGIDHHLHGRPVQPVMRRLNK